MNKINTKSSVRLGDYSFCLDSHLLTQNHQNIAVEPKVASLLAYLYNNSDRYVPLQELHDTLWEGRIVSDAAVRRTVSKLRNCLSAQNESLCEVKSLPKRGYRLVLESSVATFSNASDNPDWESEGETTAPAEPQHTEDPAMPHQFDADDDIFKTNVVTNPSVFSLSGGHAAVIPQSVTGSFDLLSKNKLMLLTAVVALVALLFFSIGTIQSNHIKSKSIGFSSEAFQTASPIETFASEKQSLAVSGNQQLIAFAGRTHGEQGFQVFVKDLESGITKQLTKQGFNVIFVEFVNEDKQVAFVDYSQAVASLYVADLDGSSEPRALQTGYKAMGKLEVDGADSVLLPILNDNEVGLIYRVNIHTGEMQQVSYSDKERVYDYLLAVSPQKNRLAYVRGSYNENQLVIQDAYSKKVYNRYFLSRSVKEAEWLNEDELLLLDDDMNIQLNIHTGDKQTWPADPLYSVKNMVSIAAEKLLFQIDVPASQYFTLSRYNGEEHDVTLLTFGQNVERLYHTSYQDEFLMVKKSQEGYAITQVNSQSGSEIELAQLKHAFFVQDVSPDNAKLLLKQGSQILLVSKIDGSITEISSEMQVLEDARFSADGRFVLYGEYLAGEWFVNRYEISSGDIEKIYAGYRSARSYDNGYILADASGDLFKMAFGDPTPIPLDIQVSFNFIQNWEVRGDYLAFAITDTQNTIITHHNLATGTSTTIEGSDLQVSPVFSMSFDGTSIIHRSQKVPTSELYLLDL